MKNQCQLELGFECQLGMERATFGRGLVTSSKIAFPVTQRMTVHPLIFSFVIINLSSVSRAPFFFGFTNFMLRLIAVSILRWRFISAFSLFLFAPPHILSHWLEPGGQSNFRVSSKFFLSPFYPHLFFLQFQLHLSFALCYLRYIYVHLFLLPD